MECAAVAAIESALHKILGKMGALYFLLPFQPRPLVEHPDFGGLFASPEDAATALIEALKNNDRGELLAIFGPDQ